MFQLKISKSGLPENIACALALTLHQPFDQGIACQNLDRKLDVPSELDAIRHAD